MMRVIMFPGTGNKNENRYIDVLVGGLRDIGVEVESWDKHFSMQKGDVFHVHWPEVIADIRARKYQRLRGDWIGFQFMRMIKRIKKNGGRLVWTVHDLKPHSSALRGTTFLDGLMTRFVAQVDVALSLTEAGLTQIKQEIPALKHARFAVVHHPHYRAILGNGVYSATERERVGIKHDQCAFAFIGTLRPNKRPDLIAQAFTALPQDKNFLIMAGSASTQMTHDMQTLVQGLPNVRLDLRRLPEEEVIKLYAATDIVVFPGVDYFNSGTLYTSWSLNVPVVAAWSPSNAELQQLVGAQWLYLYKGDFTTAVLEDAKQSLIKRNDNTVCDLSRLSPETCAREQLAAYKL